MLVTDPRAARGRPLVPLIAEAVAGGVGIVQLREKSLSTAALLELHDELRAALPSAVTLIVNGNPLVARRAGCGLHAAAVGALLDTARPAFRLYGRTVHDDAEFARALADRPDYLLAGTVFAREGGEVARPAGMPFLARVCRLTRPLPVYACGGLTPSRVPAVIRAGAHGVAVSQAILGERRPRQAAQAFTLALDVAERARAARG